MGVAIDESALVTRLLAQARDEAERACVEAMRPLISASRHGWPTLRWATPVLYAVEHGRFWTPAPRPASISAGVPRHCFANAWALALERQDLWHVEGYAYDQGLGLIVEHAWCVDMTATVIDPTWTDPERCRYFGAVFPRRLVAEGLERFGKHGLLDVGRWTRTARMIAAARDEAEGGS